MKFNLHVILSTGSTLSVLMLGCTDQPTQVRARPEAANAAIQGFDYKTREPEALARELASQFAGFGGYYFDERGDLVVRLKDPARHDEVAAALQPFLQSYPWSGHRPRDREPQVIAEPANYDFLELAAWRDRLFLPLFNLADAAWLDLDEVANGIAVGVTSDAAKHAVTQLALEVGIPPGALTIEVGPRATGGQTLNDYQRPHRGGFQVYLRNGGSCTAGPGAWLSGGTMVFLTNSHCSAVDWGLDWEHAYQPDDTDPNNYVGLEIRDPSPASCGFLSPNDCRYADVSAIASAYPDDADRGYIARTTSWAWGPGGVGSVTIDPNNPRLRLVGTVSSPTAGSTVDKIGSTSGWTFGEVGRTCVDHGVEYRNNSVLRCQWEANFGATFGDSGSPVFIWQASDNNQLLGIWWGIMRSDVNRRIFSAVWNIQQDLGTVYYITNGVQ